MDAAFLVVLVSATQTSTVPDWAQPETIPEEDPEQVRLEERRERARRKRQQRSELDYLDRQVRWRADRSFRLALHGGARVVFADAKLYAADLALGFSVRLARAWTLQARGAIGAGYGVGGRLVGGPLDGTREESGPLLTSGIEASIRVGANRFYFGLGPFGRAWKVFALGRDVELGGGGLVEIGWWLGEHRQIDLNLRLFGGAFEHRRTTSSILGTSIGVGWIL
jgi:hypothetical protein